MRIKRSTAVLVANLATVGLVCAHAAAQSAPTRKAVETVGLDGGPVAWIVAALASSVWLTLVASVLGRTAPPRRALRTAASLATDERDRRLVPARTPGRRVI